MAVGGDEILALARGVVGNRAEGTRLPGEHASVPKPHRAERPQGGLPSPPAFRLPDLRAGTVALEDYRGRRVLLVFSDPHCGPCGTRTPTSTSGSTGSAATGAWSCSW